MGECMTDPASLAKQYGPWAAAIAAAVAILQSNAVLPSRANDNPAIVALEARVSAVSARLNDHDGRIARAFDRINAESTRIAPLERSVDLLIVRADDTRNDAAELKGQLSAVIASLSDLKTDVAVLVGDISAIADRTGVNRPPISQR